MADVPKSVPTASHLHRKHTYDQLLCMPLISRRGSAVALSASALDLALRGNSLDKTSSTDKNEEQKDPAAFAAEHYNSPSNHCHSENLRRLGHRKPLQSLPKMTSANGDAQRLCHCGLLETRDAEPHPAGALRANFKENLSLPKSIWKRLEKKSAPSDVQTTQSHRKQEAKHDTTKGRQQFPPANRK